MKKQTKAVILIGGIVAIVALIIALTQFTKNDTDYYVDAITHAELKSSLENDESITVYFYDPNCSHCQIAAPLLFPLEDEYDIDIKPYDITKQPFDEYHITGTPTLVHYENGKEVERVVGNVKETGFREFIETYVVKNRFKSGL